MRDRRSPTDGPAEEPCAAPLAVRLAELLDLRPDDLLVGLGISSSGACRALLDRVSLRHQIVLVAPLQGVPRPLPPTAGMRVADMSVGEFARFPMQCSKILLDGAILGTDRAGDLVSHLFDRLDAGGRLVAVLHALGPPELGARGRAAVVAARLRESGFDLLFDSVKDPPHRYDLVGGVKPSIS